MQDNADGLQPALVVSTFTSSAYSNPEEKPEFFKMAAQYDLYIHVDASAVGGFWLHPAARRARPSLLEVDSVFLEMFYMSEGMKMVWIKKDTKWREPLTQHSHKAVQIFSVFALLGLKEMKRRLEFYSALANELRMEMAKFPMISTSAWDNFNTFCFQYKVGDTVRQPKYFSSSHRHPIPARLVTIQRGCMLIFSRVIASILATRKRVRSISRPSLWLP